MTFLGERRDVPALLAQSGFYVASSRTEGISLTILEAMSVGLPVVTTAVGGSPEIVDEGVTGHLAPAQDPAALADAIIRMCGRKEEWRAIGLAGRSRVEKHFNVRTMINGYERLYEELLVEQRSAPMNQPKAPSGDCWAAARSPTPICRKFANCGRPKSSRHAIRTATSRCRRPPDLTCRRTSTTSPPCCREARPDVVHIATPAHTHFDLARQCLQAGKHVYVEKPFTQTASEAETLVAIARERGLQICVGHDQLFDPAWLTLKERVARGEIGPVTHVESVLGYPISGQFGSQVAGDPRHWVRRLPGGLFQNTISHPLYRITEFLRDEEPEVFAAWSRRSPFDFPTELNVVVRGATVTGTLTFSSTIPSQRITRVYGAKGHSKSIWMARSFVAIGPSKAPGAFAKLLTPWKQWREAGRNLRRNLWRFAKADIHYFAGLKGLCERFYASISEGRAVPIEADEIIRVTRLMDRIFDDARAATKLRAIHRRRDTRRAAALPEELEVAR